jgi:hypothetical protein
MSDALYEFTSRIAGKNAKVEVYPDRIEWSQPTLFSKRGSTEMIPVKNISSVSTRKDGFAFTSVSVITAGNTIDFRVTHPEAEKLRQILNGLILG